MTEEYNVRYGDAAATATPELNPNGYGYYRHFTVSLVRDSGFGPLTFSGIHRSALTFVDDQPPAPYFVLEDGSHWSSPVDRAPIRREPDDD